MSGMYFVPTVDTGLVMQKLKPALEYATEVIAATRKNYPESNSWQPRVTFFWAGKDTTMFGSSAIRHPHPDVELVVNQQFLEGAGLVLGKEAESSPASRPDELNMFNRHTLHGIDNTNGKARNKNRLSMTIFFEKKK